VQEVEYGVLVKLNPRDLDVRTVSILADELFELALESGRPKLYLDFTRITMLPSLVPGKLIALDRRLRQIGGRVVLCNLCPDVQEHFEAEGWPADAAPENAGGPDIARVERLS
jgi:anti-anti-sigma regulatory factor